MPEPTAPIDGVSPSDLEVAPGVVLPPGALSISYTTSRGPGGQNVNKRSTRAELRVALVSLRLALDAADRLRTLLGRRLTDDGEIVITSGEHRSQARNRAECLDRLRDLIVRARVRPRARRRTRPSRGAVERRLDFKRRRADVKRSRRDPD
jgi:ribosome-associated protein